jgi:hypothetical protein
MQVGGHTTSEPVIAWWLDVKRVGESLRERYQVPEELTPKLLKARQQTGRDRREPVVALLKIAP